MAFLFNDKKNKLNKINKEKYFLGNIIGINNSNLILNENNNVWKILIF